MTRSIWSGRTTRRPAESVNTAARTGAANNSDSNRTAIRAVGERSGICVPDKNFDDGGGDYSGGAFGGKRPAAPCDAASPDLSGE